MLVGRIRKLVIALLKRHIPIIIMPYALFKVLLEMGNSLTAGVTITARIINHVCHCCLFLISQRKHKMFAVDTGRTRSVSPPLVLKSGLLN